MVYDFYLAPASVVMVLLYCVVDHILLCSNMNGDPTSYTGFYVYAFFLLSTFIIAEADH